MTTPPRTRRLPCAAFIAAFAAGGFSAASPFRPLPEDDAARSPPKAALEDARWARPGADLVRLLTTSPGECLASPRTEEKAHQIEVGRAAFRTPFLFGGTAARAGLSCNSCHRDGRDNPDFFLEGLSGVPGTADVTSSMFSKVREDDVFNPVEIPTLVDAAGKSTFGTAAPHGSIEAFVASAVDEEFDGAPPQAVVLSVAVYVESLSSKACPSKPVKTTIETAMSDVRRALLAADAALQRGDGATADFLFAAARDGLGRINARLPGEDLRSERASLGALSAAIADLRAAAEANPMGARREFPALMDLFEETSASVYKARKKSLYEPKRLERWLKGD